MAILKSRPRVRVRIPTEIRPGDEFRATVVLDCSRAVDIGGVHVRLEGTDRWTIGSGDHAVSRRNDFLSLGAQLSGARKLPKGRTELSLYIPLPESAPPTFKGSAATIEYTLHVHVAVPWWADRRASFDVFVAPPEVPSPEPQNALYSSNPHGPVGTEPHCEISVASVWTRSGDIVSGALALANVAQNRYSEVRVGLRGVETIYDAGKTRTEREYMRYQIRLGAEQVTEGEMIPFRFRLPPEAAAEMPWGMRPNGQPPLSSLAWQLEVVVGIRWAQDLTLRVPYRVLPASARPGDAPSRLAPPTVGSDRLRELWQGIGEQHGLHYDTQTLVGQLGGTTLSIRRDLTGRRGVFVVAELGYPELHLALDVAPATKVQMMVGGGALIGDAAWDRDHYVRARDEGQAAEVLRMVVPAMRGGTLRRMDDRRLTLEVRDTGAQRPRMEQFVAAAAQLARTFEGVRRALPPPPAMRDAVPAWNELARRIAGTLEPARMRIEGQLATMTAEVRLSFDETGQPLGTWLTVGAPTPLDASHTIRVVGGPEAASQLEGRFEGETLELIRIIGHGALELAVEPDRVAIGLPLLFGLPTDAPAAAAARALPTITLTEQPPALPVTAALAEQRLNRLAALITTLRGQAGPYR
ncbi:MAG: hypothetical protein KC619_25395 [Myxococcales bacterium]|nr:hypothetical protein [Myxococcales bacterium]